MSDHLSKARQAVHAAIDEINEMQGESTRIPKSDDTTLLREVKSLALVELIVATEQKLEELFNVRVNLADRVAQAPEGNPLATVGSLVAYIASAMTDRATG